MSASSHASRAAYSRRKHCFYSRVFARTRGFKDCPIYALSPRAGHAISIDARRRLNDLRVHDTDTILNSECHEYGSANRVAVAAHIEETRRHEILVILDSDTLFLREPREFVLPSDIDVAPRPVDIKGMCTTGPQNSFDAYWRALCRCCGVDYDEIPWSETFITVVKSRRATTAGLPWPGGISESCANGQTFSFCPSVKGFDRTPNPHRFGPVSAGSKVRPESSGAETRRR